MLDGRHTGTGGGNHFVLGGATPADSPFLRRPDLLRSLVAYWHNHPSLSYLFSGLFIGPTSQAPRVDEARHDRVYELEIAFAADRRAPARPRRRPGWSTGCSATCWSTSPATRTAPSSASTSCTRPTGRPGGSGLLELRAFEMPPHARMSLAQQLLLRALVARFWREPYRERLVRWGTELHDRFMLPHFVWQDFDDVLDELQRARLRVRRRVVRAALRVPLPALGDDRASRGVELELRQALEPWHVLGEEGGRGGTARYVDSSVERLQVQVARPDRRPLRRHLQRPRAAARSRPGRTASTSPACATAPGSPPSCLHPTIRVHAPLVFDLVERGRGRSLGGCTYHVAHPGRPQLRAVPGQRLRGREPAPRALLPVRPHARGRRRAAARAAPRISVHARSALVALR